MRPRQALSSVLLVCAAVLAVPLELPVVDLGYELHQAIDFNVTGQYYNFSNIPFATPPLGELRFAAPTPPKTNRSAVNTGVVTHICFQQLPEWLASEFHAPPDPRESEDCLYLDVMVPKRIFDGSLNGTNSGAPVLVWIFGGGYVVGDKQVQDDPAGLLAKATAIADRDGDEGVIWVAINYRLGALGWLAGQSFRSEGGVPNVGLLDQSLGLQWVQEHIAKFGGDPDRVTVFGVSAGGGSVLHQVTAYGGKGKVSFQQAYAMSPGLPLIDAEVQDVTYCELLKIAGVSSLKELRSLDTAALHKANSAVIVNSSYGTFTFGPVVDGSFVLDVPTVLLREGKFHKEIKEVMAGHVSNEGTLFTDPSVTTNAEFISYVGRMFPFLSYAKMSYVVNTLYPPPNSTTNSLYNTQFGRVALLFADAHGLTCATNALSSAFGPDDSYSYVFAIPPGSHGEDIPYVYYNGPSSAVINATVADILQSFVVNFAMSGKPDAQDGYGVALPRFPSYGAKNALEIGMASFDVVEDPTANDRCYFWQDKDTYGWAKYV